jgi:thiosulfate/3-mercaptopyruvate sulfurtransferase
LDVRRPTIGQGDRSAGDPGARDPAGHIPGAKNVPWKSAVKEDGTFKDVAELKQLYGRGRRRRLEAGEHVLPHRRALEPLVVRAEVPARIRRAQYDGSWTEYGNAVGVPIENPAGTVWTGK